MRLMAIVTAVVFLIVIVGGCSAGGQADSRSGGAECAASGWHEYADRDGDSAVTAYRLGRGCIEVRFDDGSEYLYTDTSAGAANINRMRQLALGGDGLGAFIQSTVHDRYAEKS
mgnify:CR=1 FL=1